MIKALTTELLHFSNYLYSLLKPCLFFIETMIYRRLKFILLILLLTGSAACNMKTGRTAQEKQQTVEKKNINVPEFNADSAYYFVKVQTDFGPRIPFSKAHEDCAKYLTNTLQRFSDSVIVQSFKARDYSGKVLEGKNIIGIFQPEKKVRIMLCSHWDSRPYADHDPDKSKHNTPISAANDGASGVGVLLEIARVLSLNHPGIGVDIVLFDLEDDGPPDDDQIESKNEYWGLGSQYWAHNLHVLNYSPRFAVLLDMVGAKDAVFRKEGFSMYYAPDKVREVWDVARELGFQNYFVDEKGGYINDDHYFINDIAKIPAIDIIHLDPNSSNGSFYEYWHTTGDTLDKIDKETLRIVGKTLLQVIFEE